MEAKVEFNKTKSIKPNYKRYLLNTICSVIFVIVLSLLTKTLSLKLIIPQMIIFSIAALSLNIVCGCLGEMVLGHGGFIIGIVQQLSMAFPVTSTWTPAIVYGLLILILMIKPTGILGKMVGEKV